MYLISTYLKEFMSSITILGIQMSKENNCTNLGPPMYLATYLLFNSTIYQNYSTTYIEPGTKMITTWHATKVLERLKTENCTNSWVILVVGNLCLGT